MRQVESNVELKRLEIKKFTAETIISITKMNNYSFSWIYRCSVNLLEFITRKIG